MKAAAGVASSVRPVASAPQARLPVEEAAAASGAKVQPPGAAEAESAPSARQPGAAEVASDAEEAQPPEAAGVALDAVAEPQQAVAAEGLLDAEVQRPGVAEEPVPSVRQPAAAHPSAALPSWRPGAPSSLACATTSGAVCACDAEVASCVAVKAVVASSRMRRFVMMSLVPGIGLTATERPSLACQLVD